MRKKEKHTIRYEIDPTNPPALTDKQIAELEALARKPDSEIDYSDIPPVEDMSQFYRPIKEMTTIRIDADILAWLRSQGKGYQTKINASLRREMISSQPHHR
jgi:uncharacterized protein (DUF4415 family)